MKKILSEFHLTPAQMKAINDEGKKKLKELKKKAKETKATDKPKKVKKEPKSREIPVPKKRGRPKKVEPEPKKRGRPKAIKVDLTALKKSNSAVKKKQMLETKKSLLREQTNKNTDRKALIAKVAKEASEDDKLQSLSDRLKNVVVKPSEAEFEAPTSPAPKKRGRPVGSKNKPKSQLNENLHLEARIDPADVAHYERMRQAQDGFVIPHIDRSESRPRGQADADEAIALLAKLLKKEEPKEEPKTKAKRRSSAPLPPIRARSPSVTPISSPIHEPNYSEGKSESAEEQLARLVAESIANDKKVTVKDVEREAKKQGLEVKGERKIKIRKIAQALKNAAPKVTISHAGVKGAEAAEVSDTRANGKLYNWAAKIRYPKEDIEQVQEGKPLIVTDKEGKEHNADFLIEGVSVFIPRNSRLSDFGEMLHFNSFIEKLHDYMKTHTGAFGFVGGNAEQFDALRDVLPIEKLEAKNRRPTPKPAPKKKFVSAEPKEEKPKEDKPKTKGKKAPPPPPREPPETASVLSPISESKPSYRFRDNYTHGSDIESEEELSDSDNEGRGIDFQDIKWGSLTEQFNIYKKHHKGIQSLDDFAHHILSHPKDFNSRTRKRANFYVNVIKGKGIKEGDSDSDTSSDSDSEGKISTHNIMPIVRPHCFHPATESSTMTMNPGAFNNIKPLLGHLMVGGGHPHTPVERTSNGMRTHSHYGPHAMGHHHAPEAMYVKHSAMRPHNHGGSIADLIHASAQHMTHTFGHPAPMALDIMNKAIRDGIETLHPDLRPHATQALNGGHKLLARTIGGAFFGDLGNSIKSGFENMGHDIGHQIENKASKVYNKSIKPALPGIVGSMDQYYNSPATQATMSAISTGLNSTGSPELGIPLSMANMALSNALDASAHGRNPNEQLEHRYVAPVKKAVKKGRKMLGLGAGKDLSKILAKDTGRLADSGSDYLIRQMEGHGAGKDLAKNLAGNTGRLADSGTDYLVRQMEGHGSPMMINGKPYNAKGGKVGQNLAKNLAENTGRLADSGTDYLIRQMGGEIGDGLHAQGGRGRGFKKGSAEAKAHMAKIRGMKGKGMKNKATKDILSDPNYGGAIPQPPSRSPVTRGGSFQP